MSISPDPSAVDKHPAKFGKSDGDKRRARAAKQASGLAKFSKGGT